MGFVASSQQIHDRRGEKKTLMTWGRPGLLIRFSSFRSRDAHPPDKLGPENGLVHGHPCLGLQGAGFHCPRLPSNRLVTASTCMTAFPPARDRCCRCSGGTPPASLPLKAIRAIPALAQSMLPVRPQMPYRG